MAMFEESEKWRKDFKVDELYENFEYPEKEKVNEVYPQYYHKQDKVSYDETNWGLDCTTLNSPVRLQWFS